MQSLLAIILETSGVLGTLLGIAYGVYQKWIKPWAEKIDRRTESTDNAVNHGRMERVEAMLERGTDRMDRADSRSDRIEERLDMIAQQSGNRFTSLDKGQTTMQGELNEILTEIRGRDEDLVKRIRAMGDEDLIEKLLGGPDVG